jgi:hypothetical protein
LPYGSIYTVAGDGHAGFRGDGALATRARINGPDAVTVDPRGNLVIDDTENSRIRVVADSSGTFYGEHMSAGNIYTVAGDGLDGFAGDGGPPPARAVPACGGRGRPRREGVHRGRQERTHPDDSPPTRRRKVTW